MTCHFRATWTVKVAVLWVQVHVVANSKPTCEIISTGIIPGKGGTRRWRWKSSNQDATTSARVTLPMQANRPLARCRAYVPNFTKRHQAKHGTIWDRRICIPTVSHRHWRSRSICSVYPWHRGNSWCFPQLIFSRTSQRRLHAPKLECLATTLHRPGVK